MTKAVLRIRRDSAGVLAEMGRRFTGTWKSGRPAAAHVFSFESPAALFRVLSPKRWELLERLQALGPTSVRGLARELERDVKRVHEDVGVLVEVGLVEKTAGGKIHVPYAVIEAEFALRAA
jgi:predicted transcriptional regulator